MTTLQCLSPIDGSVFATRQALSLDEARGRIEEAKRAQKVWAQVPLDDRITQVMAGVANLGAMNEEITVELAHMMGRPVRYGGEFGGVQERADYMAGLAPSALAPTIIEDSDAYERRLAREPMGLVFVIAPWNYPYLTAMNTVVPALIAGNAVLIKHAEQTLLVGERIAQAFHQAGMPDELIANIFVDHPTAEALLGEGAFDYVNFTGSVEGGRRVERAAAGTFTSMSFELGGKDAGYVMDDADLDAAVETLVDGAMFNSGQCCCGIERIYVTAKHYDAFVEKAVALTRGYRLGNPLDEATTIGPMANERFAKTVRRHISDAMGAGAVAHIPTLEGDDGGAYVSPQILTNVDHTMALMREETFGPVVGIMKVENDEEAIALMNDSAYGLTASLWTSDAERAAAIGARLENGIVFMNRCDYVDPALCWTGCKNTGRGGSLSILGFHAVTRPKSYHLKKQL
ncbi:MAG: aldehyde dehydrogenase family protein [Rhizobiales bacterium]|nr:aldehyde dehydrogenase family protein [Hyphomicrobiales bacterium]MBO6697608.1 aldehyde dehydrogenase family protein [Hyphomicrobiales bacterium]MBO6736137.1 aldehyde dehydrogenase family protein [Hyphomicrobiales bacterium]MBO6912607.1 aldehyde dehydrogenase family protein [Hyphomicrobiales bacterium]MBO6956820.1 aldehyde dehydrogenase family protein [Hyphomicrobiales bacterium]